MRGSNPRRRTRSRTQIPRTLPGEASAVFKRCERILEDSSELLANLRSAGIAELFARLDDKVLQLAIQPDSWGERTRARLMSGLAPALCTPISDGTALNIEGIAEVANAIIPCLLLEVGRRKGHIQVKFPLNPAERNARIDFSVSPSQPMRHITADRILRVVENAGDALVRLCYFGDDESRDVVEAQLSNAAQA